MAKSNRLRLSEIDAVYRLVNECRELWADPTAWRQHLVCQASRLLGLTLVQYAELSLAKRGGFPLPLCYEAAGLDQDGHMEIYLEARKVYPNKFDFFLGSKRLLRGLSIGAQRASLREELCTDRAWYRSKVYNEFRRTMNNNGNVISVVQHQAALVTTMDANQCMDDPCPSLHTKVLLSLLHRVIDPLVGTELATEYQRCLHGLSPQLRITLKYLLAGNSEKEIATKLGLRLPTVHDYVGKLYRHFNVASRAELLAYFIHRHPEPK